MDACDSMPTPRLPSSAVIELNYAPAVGRSRRWFRGLALLAAVICFLPSARPLSLRIAHYARATYWEYQCMYFDPPADVPIRTCDDSTRPVSPPYTRAGYLEFNSDLVPDCFVKYVQETETKQYSLYYPIELPIFCHERTSPSGQHRLVVLQLGGNLTNSGDRHLFSQIFEPNLFGGRKIAEGYPWTGRQLMEEGSVTDTLLLAWRIYPGLPDPRDGSHFTIDYETKDHKRGTIDGWLQDNAVIRLSARPGPIDVNAYWNEMEANQ
jgi:hypothetical protein